MIKKFSRFVLVVVLCSVLVFGASANTTQAKAKVNNKHYKIIEKRLDNVDKIKCIDKYKKGRWYCYYVYANGDIYTITIKNGKIDKLYQLN